MAWNIYKKACSWGATGLATVGAIGTAFYAGIENLRKGDDAPSHLNQVSLSAYGTLIASWIGTNIYKLWQEKNIKDVKEEIKNTTNPNNQTDNGLEYLLRQATSIIYAARGFLTPISGTLFAFASESKEAQTAVKAVGTTALTLILAEAVMANILQRHKIKASGNDIPPLSTFAKTAFGISAASAVTGTILYSLYEEGELSETKTGMIAATVSGLLTGLGKQAGAYASYYLAQLGDAQQHNGRKSILDTLTTISSIVRGSIGMYAVALLYGAKADRDETVDPYILTAAALTIITLSNLEQVFALTNNARELETVRTQLEEVSPATLQTVNGTETAIL